MNTVVNVVIRLFERWMPEPFAFAVLMTLSAMILAWGLTPAEPGEVLLAWGDGLSMLLPFITQVAITVMLAFGLAHVGPVPRLLHRLAGMPRSRSGAYAFCALFTSLVSVLCWPLGTIMGGLMANRVGLSCKARGIDVHYPLLAGAAFSGFVVWHMGYTASAPLMVATEGNALQGLMGGVLPVTQTIFAPFNLLTLVATASLIAYLATRLHPENPEPVGNAPLVEPEAELTGAPRPGFAGYVEQARWPTTMVGIILCGYVGYTFVKKGIRLDLNLVNWSFLALCLLLTRSAGELADVLTRAGRAVIPILLQYPLFAGIMGVLLGSGLVARIADYFSTIGSAETLPLIAFLTGGLLNLFIPSGGAQWAVQGPAFLEAAKQLGTDPALIVMGVAYGDQWTNIIHPFVLIPVLIMTGLRANQVLPYSFVLFLAASVPLAAGLYLAAVI